VAAVDVGAASEEDGSGDLLPVSVAVPAAVDVGAGALDEVTVAVAGTEDVLRLMIVAGAAVDEEAEEVVADGDAVSELAADEDVAVAGADEVMRTMVEGGAVPVLADELKVAELDAVPVAVSLAVVLLSVRVAALLDAVLVAVLEVAGVVTELLVVAAVPVAVADEEMDVWVVELAVVVPVWPTGSSLTVHFVTFSNTSSPAAFFLGVRVTLQVSVTLPAALYGVISKASHRRSIGWTHVSVVVVVVTVLDPSA
jgi:hypothetical protein